MKDDRKQQRFLSLLLFGLVLLVAWFFLLKPSVDEQKGLQADLNSRQTVERPANSWQRAAEKEAGRLGLRLLAENNSGWRLQGSFPRVLDLAAFIEGASPETLSLSKKGRQYTLSW